MHTTSCETERNLKLHDRVLVHGGECGEVIAECGFSNLYGCQMYRVKRNGSDKVTELDTFCDYELSRLD